MNLEPEPNAQARACAASEWDEIAKILQEPSLQYTIEPIAPPETNCIYPNCNGELTFHCYLEFRIARAKPKLVTKTIRVEKIGTRKYSQTDRMENASMFNGRWNKMVSWLCKKCGAKWSQYCGAFHSNRNLPSKVPTADDKIICTICSKEVHNAGWRTSHSTCRIHPSRWLTQRERANQMICERNIQLQLEFDIWKNNHPAPQDGTEWRAHRIGDTFQWVVASKTIQCRLCDKLFIERVLGNFSQIICPNCAKLNPYFDYSHGVVRYKHKADYKHGWAIMPSTFPRDYYCPCGQCETWLPELMSKRGKIMA